MKIVNYLERILAEIIITIALFAIVAMLKEKVSLTFPWEFLAGAIYLKLHQIVSE